MIERVVPEQVHPLKFFGLLVWIDGRPLLEVMEPYRQRIQTESLFTFRPDGAPQYKRRLSGRAKKNSKTGDEVLAALYKLLAWKPAGHRGSQVYFVASDLGQANDDLDLCKKLITVNPVLAQELEVYRNVIHRKDEKGFIEILPAGDAPGLHGKTYLFLVIDELHTQRTYDVLQALELDRTRPDAMQSFASYASMSRASGVPINDILTQHAAKTDPRLYVSWYAGTIEDANPSLNGPLGPTLEDILDAQRSLPSWIFRRLYHNLPGQPDSAALDAGKVEQAIVKSRTVFPPRPAVHYHAGCDLSGGGDDDATLAITHTERDRVVVDCLVDQGPRQAGRTFDPQQTIERFAAVLHEYRCNVVVGDRYAAQWPIQAFAKLGITYRQAEQNRSQIYAAFEPLLNSGQVELLDHPKLFPQLIGLVRKGEKIDHATGEHDDHANAVALAVICAARAASISPFGFSCAGQSLVVGTESKPVEAGPAAPAVELAPGVLATAQADSSLAEQVRQIRLKPIIQRTVEETVLVEQFFEAQHRACNALNSLERQARTGGFFPDGGGDLDVETEVQAVRDTFQQGR
jgi:hypothetical protein